MKRSKNWYSAIRRYLYRRWHTDPKWLVRNQAILRKMRKASIPIMKKMWRNPEYRRRMSKLASETILRLRKDPEFLKRSDKARAASWTPERRVREKKRQSALAKKIWRNPEFRVLMSKKTKKQWKDPEFAKKVLGSLSYPSKPQIKLFKRLRRAGVKGIQLEKQCGRYWIDIACKLSRVAIEVDGPYWHKDKNHFKRDSFLKRRGWEVVRIPLIKNNVLEKDYRKILSLVA